MAARLLIAITILICIHDSHQQATLSITPINEAAVLGSDVTFECQVLQSTGLTDYISWEECITPNDGKCLRISNDEDIVYSDLGGDSAREDRYSIVTGVTGRYDLTISGITAEDAGRYNCLARNTADSYYSAELVVLDTVPICESNATNSSTTAFTDPIYISCEVDYYGFQAPEVEFGIQGGSTLPGIDGTVSGDSSGHMEFNTTILPGTANCVFIYAKTLFAPFPPGGEKNASNAPYYYDVVKYFVGGPSDDIYCANMSTTKFDPTIYEETGTTTELPGVSSNPGVSSDLETWEIAAIGAGAGVVVLFIIITVVVVCVKKGATTLNTAPIISQSAGNGSPANSGNTQQKGGQNALPETFNVNGYVNPDYQQPA